MIIDVLTAPWAIMPTKLEEISNVYSTHLRGDKIDLKGLEASLGQPLGSREQGYENIDGVAVIAFNGVVGKKMNLLSNISGGVSTQTVERDFLQAMEDPDVHSIVFDIDSPGGSVDGTHVLAKVIAENRGTKPIISSVNGLMASAAYWVGSAADEIFITSETDHIGSIGVVAQHVDKSENQKKNGVVVTDIFAGKFKRMNSENAALTKDGKALMQAQVDGIYTIFVEQVAINRNVSVETVLSNMADGQVFLGEEALERGLVDGIKSLDQVIATLVARHEGDEEHENSNMVVQSGVAKRAETISKTVSQSGVAIEAIEKPNPEAKLSGDLVAVGSIKTKEDHKMDLETLKSDHPELVEALVAESRESALAEGADTERGRIQGVMDMGMTGYESMIAELAFDGKTTGPEAAVKILAAEKGKRESVVKNNEEDAAILNEVGAGSSENGNTETTETITADLSTEEGLKAAWDKDANLRAEFGDNFATFESYNKANARGLVKVMGKK